jgi:hypothetical protein
MVLPGLGCSSSTGKISIGDWPEHRAMTTRAGSSWSRINKWIGREMGPAFGEPQIGKRICQFFIGNRFIRMPLRDKWQTTTQRSAASWGQFTVTFILQVRSLLIGCLHFCGPYWLVVSSWAHGLSFTCMGTSVFHPGLDPPLTFHLAFGIFFIDTSTLLFQSLEIYQND